MNTAILVAQVLALFLQACLVLVGILLVAAAIRNNDELRQRNAHAAMDEALALVEQVSHEPMSEPGDPWQGKWPPWTSQ